MKNEKSGAVLSLLKGSCSGYNAAQNVLTMIAVIYMNTWLFMGYSCPSQKIQIPESGADFFEASKKQ